MKDLYVLCDLIFNTRNKEVVTGDKDRLTGRSMNYNLAEKSRAKKNRGVDHEA